MHRGVANSMLKRGEQTENIQFCKTTLRNAKLIKICAWKTLYYVRTALRNAKNYMQRDVTIRFTKSAFFRKLGFCGTVVVGDLKSIKEVSGMSRIRRGLRLLFFVRPALNSTQNYVRSTLRNKKFCKISGN